MKVINRVVAGEVDAETGRQIFTRRSDQRKMTERDARSLDAIEQTSRGAFRGVRGNVGPYMGEVGFCFFR
jgi:hypothetical protein